MMKTKMIKKTCLERLELFRQCPPCWQGLEKHGSHLYSFIDKLALTFTEKKNWSHLPRLDGISVATSANHGTLRNIGQFAPREKSRSGADGSLAWSDFIVWIDRLRGCQPRCPCWLLLLLIIWIARGGHPCCHPWEVAVAVERVVVQVEGGERRHTWEHCSLQTWWTLIIITTRIIKSPTSEVVILEGENGKPWRSPEGPASNATDPGGGGKIIIDHLITEAAMRWGMGGG